MSENSSRTVSTERALHASAQRIFAAFARPEQLAEWWGPEGFTSTFELFEFVPGGRWVFAMHAPTGATFPNECIFREIRTDSAIVIEHVVNPKFVLTVTLTPRGEDVHLGWAQTFETPELAAKMRPLVATANEQVLDRLAALLAREP